MKILVAILTLALALPLAARQDEHDNHDHAEHSPAETAGEQNAVDQMIQDSDSASGSDWTCPMHPQVSRDGPGQCPICGMDLVEREQSDDETTVRVPGRIQQSMNLRTSEVQRGRLWRRIDTVGRVQVDETGLVHLHPRVEGWVGKLDVNAVGEPVEAGQRLFTLYSRELVNAQEEFLQALRSGGAEMARAARQRLAALDVQPQVIERIERDRQVIEYLPWHAAQDGYVRTLNIRPGMFVAPGSDMLVIADPDRVWVMADVFAGQMAWIEAGQAVEITREARPGRTLDAEIDFVYPELDETTRTARARIAIEDAEAGLRPGEWATVTIYAGPKDDLLFVPTEALIRTGTATRVVLRDDDERFSVRDVRAGMESGEYTEIVAGVSEGEEVVTSGQFLVDSEANLRAGHDRLGGSHDH